MRESFLNFSHDELISDSLRFNFILLLFLQIATLLSLQSLVAMAARCFIFSDVVSMKCNEDELGTRLSERSRTFVTELFLVFENGNEAALRRVLETCSPTWLRMQVTDMLLVNYNDHLVPLERRHLNTKGLSLEKIVGWFCVLRSNVLYTLQNAPFSKHLQYLKRKI